MTDYPKIYQPSSVQKLLVALLSIALLLPSLAFIAEPLPQQLHGVHMALVLAFIAMCPILSIHMLALAFISKVKLYVDRVEVTALFGTKSIGRNEIQGYCISSAKGATFVHLIPKNGQQKVIVVSGVYARDVLFSAWLDGIEKVSAVP
jgi:hypothetical protein